MEKIKSKQIGHILFGTGLLLSLVSGLVGILTKNNKIFIILMIFVFIIGLITGYHNIKRREVNSYLLASLVLVVFLSNSFSLVTYLVSGLGIINYKDFTSIVTPISKIINTLIVFISAAALIPALKIVLKILEE